MRIILIWVATFFLLMSSSVLVADELEKDPILAKVGSQTWKMSDLQDRQIHGLRKKLYQALARKLQLQALQELAKTKSEYRLNYKPQISEKEISGLYEERQLQSRGSLSALRGRIHQYLASIKLVEEIEKKYQKAVKAGLIQNFLQNPGDFLLTTKVKTAFIRGSKTAKVMLLEFSDYQCPYCGLVQNTLNQLQKEYKNKVSFGYRHFPLSIHREADEAAIAVECARDQGKFEEYHTELFKKDGRGMSNDDLKSLAKKVKIPRLAQFNSCLKTEKYRSRVNQDIADASKIGVRSTPSFIIGVYDPVRKIIRGELLSGALPKKQIAQYLDKYLKKVK
ncbi:MAG: protein-disulfide isomerase [bacterium]|jgi:protein-disulfide isomerase